MTPAADPNREQIIDLCRKFGGLFEMIPVGVGITDASGRVIYSSPLLGKIRWERMPLLCWPRLGKVGGDHACTSCPIPGGRAKCPAFREHRRVRHGALRDASGAVAAQVAVVFEDCQSRGAEAERRLRTFEGAIRRISNIATASTIAAGVIGFKPTDREEEVLALLAANYRVKSIATELGISPSTVRNHLKAIFRKAGVGSQAELVERLKTPPESA